MQIKVMRKIMDENNEIAENNRSFFTASNVTAINVMASPGAGKTSVIMGLLGVLIRANISCGVVEGDIASSIDAEKIEAIGVPVVQINTGGGCHLDANMVREAAMDLEVNDGFLLIENVGNLVCPSSFDLGEGLRMVIASVPEGHDKPFKYLSMFECADVIVLNKMDLIDYIDFDMAEFRRGVDAINSRHAPIFEVACRTGHGIQELADYLLSVHRGR